MPSTRTNTDTTNPHRLTKAAYYFDHEIAHILACSTHAARRMLKDLWGGEPSPTGGKSWIIRHDKLMRVARGNYGNFRFFLDAIDGLDGEERELLEVQP